MRYYEQRVLRAIDAASYAASFFFRAACPTTGAALLSLYRSVDLFLVALPCFKTGGSRLGSLAEPFVIRPI